ncbi:MAG: hypothetical protein WDN49_24865 [Acetobacteraceae bacterium]
MKEARISDVHPIVRLHAVRKAFRGQAALALDDVSPLRAARRDLRHRRAVGRGKSTLLRCVNLLERPDSGQVEVAGQDMLSLSPAGLARGPGAASAWCSSISTCSPA